MAGQFFEDELRRHEAVLHALAQDVGGLGEDARNLMQPGNVILVVLHRIERDGERQIGEPGVDTALLVHRHLIILQVVVDVLALQLPLEQAVAQQILVVHAVGGDGFQPLQEIVGFRMLACDFLQRNLAEQRVVAVVAEGGRALRRILEPGLIELIEQFILLRHAIGDGRRLGENRTG